MKVNREWLLYPKNKGDFFIHIVSKGVRSIPLKVEYFTNTRTINKKSKSGLVPLKFDTLEAAAEEVFGFLEHVNAHYRLQVSGRILSCKITETQVLIEGTEEQLQKEIEDRPRQGVPGGNFKKKPDV